MIYNLSKSILFKNRYFIYAVFPHSLGPDFIHLKVSGNLLLTIIFLSFIHDCRLPLTSINKLDGEGAKPLVPQPQDRRSLHQHYFPRHIHIVSRVYLFVWLGKGKPCYTNQGLRPFTKYTNICIIIINIINTVI